MTDIHIEWHHHLGMLQRFLMHEEEGLKSFLKFIIFTLKKGLILIEKCHIDMLIILSKGLWIYFISYLWEKHSCIFDVS